MKTSFLPRLTALAIMAFALVSVASDLRAAAVDAVVKSVSGSVQAAAPGSDSFSSISVGQKLPTGTTIKTGAGSEAIIVATPGAAVRIDENTTIKVENMQFSAPSGGALTQRKATIDLKSGTVSSLIDHSTPDVTDFVVKTPQGSAAARGTFYGVTVKNGQTFYKVQEGKVGIAAAPAAEKKKSDAAGADSTAKPASTTTTPPPAGKPAV